MTKKMSNLDAERIAYEIYIKTFANWDTESLTHIRKLLQQVNAKIEIEKNKSKH